MSDSRISMAKELSVTQERRARHSSFSVSKAIAAPTDRVFAAWTDPATKQRWFSVPAEWKISQYSLDARPGGREVMVSEEPGGPVHHFEARFEDVVAGRRLVSITNLAHDASRVGTVLVTVEITPDGEGSRLDYTEQAVFFDGHEPDHHEQAIRSLLDGLVAFLEGGGDDRVDS